MDESDAEPHETILAGLVQHGLLPQPEGFDLLPAGGGLNSQVFFVQHHDGPPLLTVRASTPDRAWRLQREAGILQSLADTCDCAPKPIALIEPAGSAGLAMLVHAYAPGGTIKLHSATDERLAKLGSCLATIHRHQRDHFTIWPDLVVTTGTRAQAFLARLAAVERYTSFSSRANESLFRSVQYVYRNLQRMELRGEGWDETTFSLLHGDLSQGNMLWDGVQVCLIDWEYARAGDPAEELAYLLAEQELAPEQVETILSAYVASGGDASAASRIATYSAVVSLDSVLWWADYDIRNDRAPGSSEEVAYHLARSRAALNRI